MKYTYSTVRFVPDPAKGEFVNIGLIVGSDETGDWRIETIQNRNRARYLDDGRKSFPSVVAELEKIAAQIDLSSELEDETEYDVSREWLRRMAGESRGIVQYSTPRSVLAETADDAIDVLLPELLVDSEVTRRNIIGKKNLRAAFRTALQRRSVTSEHSKENVSLRASQSRSEVDFALHNGSVKQLTQCWSFQLQDTDKVLKDVKSWAWTIRGLRHSGGSIVANDEQFSVPKNVPLKVVYAKPAESVGEDVMSEAVDAFHDPEVDAEIYEFSKIDAAAESAAKLIEA